MNKEVSIIVPIYNAERYLNESLSSIVNQSIDDFEVILVDDGSVDSSKEICKEWCAKDKRFEYFYQQNSGVSAARNLGIGNANGQYICFLDADDYYDSKYLETLLGLVSGNDAALCDYTRDEDLGHSGGLKVASTKELILDVIYERIKHPGLYCFLYKRSIIEDNKIRFTVGCIKNEDTEFYIKYLASCSEPVAVTSYKGYYYRPNPSSVMSAPMTEKSFTSIEAARRINQDLYRKHIIEDNTIVYFNSVLVYAYKLSRRGEWNLYKDLHDKHDVSKAMRKMLSFPRLSKKIVASIYLVIGKAAFYALFKTF